MAETPLQPLYGSRALAQWVRQGGAPERPVRAHALRQWWQALWFEQNWRTQWPRLASLPAPTDPVFILGLWRSGTTVLHELLAASTGWLTPQTWQCFAPATCFLSGAPAARSSAARPMDRGIIATHGPQEDEFALLLLGEPSLYRGFIDPRRLSDPALLDIASPDTTRLPRWQAFVRGIAGQDPQRRLLLKSPNHTFRLPLLRALYPQARFLWMARHTGEVLASNLKMWRSMMQLHGLWHCPPGALESFLRRVLAATSDVLAGCLEEMPREQLLWVDFERLRAEPRRTLEQILGFLGPAPGGRDPCHDIDRALAQVPLHAGERSDMPDTVEVHRLEQRMAAARQRFGAAPTTERATAVVAPPRPPR